MMSVARKALVLLLSGAVLAMQFACATYTAVKIPGPTHDEDFAIGMHRSQVESILAASPASEYKDGEGISARYDYRDGPHQASKGRVVLYIAGDIFTIFLSELIFWPIEAYARNQTKRVGTAHYDSHNRLTRLSVSRPSGEELFAIGRALEDAEQVAGPPPTDTPAIESDTMAESNPVPESGSADTTPAVSAEPLLRAGVSPGAAAHHARR